MSRPRLETIANAVVISAGLVVLAAYLKPWLDPPPSPRSAVETYAVGDRVELSGDVRIDRDTFLLYTRSKCAYCDASMELYRQLIDKGARVIAVTAEQTEMNQSYLAGHRVRPERVLAVAGSGLRFRVTPSLVLVNRDAKVVNAWWGKQDKKTEEAILRTVQ
jgi:hypothetical protein